MFSVRANQLRIYQIWGSAQRSYAVAGFPMALFSRYTEAWEVQETLGYVPNVSEIAFKCSKSADWQHRTRLFSHNLKLISWIQARSSFSPSPFRQTSKRSCPLLTAAMPLRKWPLNCIRSYCYIQNCSSDTSYFPLLVATGSACFCSSAFGLFSCKGI